MSSLLDAARALAGGDPLRALAGVGRDDSARGLTLRGIAYAQLGDLELARSALELAVTRADDPLLVARARAALCEVELGSGAPAAAASAARAAADALERLGDSRNAAMQRLVLARAEVLLGRLNEARRVAGAVLARDLGPDLRAVASLVQAEIAVRALAPTDASEALARAREALTLAPHQLLARTVEALEHELARPVASVWRAGATSEADLFAIQALARGHVLLVDACRRLVLAGRVTVPLARRPVLFALLLELARAWPAALARDELAARGFAVRRVNDSHRARLRVELGRLRKLMDGLAAAPTARADGYVLDSQREVVILTPPTDDETARLGLLLGDGAAWSAQALAEHAGVSRRTAQRALQSLVERGVVVRTGKGKDIRYTRPGAPIASRMLLLGLVPAG
ncbi:HTH domain-containing protein [Nannocystis bainbridge]|uniref:HTH domain-containing protein n=1 Tax=Nannocystis bainbridge TaxID=2995303 RepID=A0ABT5E4V6_9BACT|nr:HTH domain-containing protein [Nannocystis bainbridge]MDC0720463.1 HTH domain-containing protein [Nannocystis bainbridge]